MSGSWTYNHKQTHFGPCHIQPQHEVLRAQVPESDPDEGWYFLEPDSTGQRANQQVLQESDNKVDRLSSLPPDILRHLCQSLSVHESVQQPNPDSSLTPHKAQETGSCTLALLNLRSCCRRLVGVCGEVFTSLHYSDLKQKQLEPFLKKHQQIKSVSLEIQSRVSANVHGSLAILYSILPGLILLKLNSRLPPPVPAEPVFPRDCVVKNISKALWPWSKTLQHLELANVRFVPSNKLGTRSLAFLPALKCLQALCLHDVHPLGSLKDLSRCTGLLKLTLSAELGGRQGITLSLDVSSLVLLQELFCANYLVNSINVAGLTQLKLLNCNANHISMIDLSTCTALTGLQCQNNSLVALDVSGCCKLVFLACGSSSGERLSDLRLAGCTDLQRLHCKRLSMASLDLAGHSQLREVSIMQSSISLIDMSGCTNLQDMKLSENATLATLLVAGCRKLGTLVVSCCFLLQALNLAGCTTLQHLTCHDTPLCCLDMTTCVNLVKLFYHRIDVRVLDVSSAADTLQLLCCSECPKLEVICTRGCRRLTTLLFYTCPLVSELDCDGCSALTDYCVPNPSTGKGDICLPLLAA